MASSGSDLPDPTSLASFLRLLFGSRNGEENGPRVPPFLLSLRNPPNSSNPDGNSTNPDAENVRERLVMINPFTQTMLVIESSSSRGGGDSNEESAFESWMNDFFFRKEGQPPASKASMEAMPEVEIGGKGVECVICLEEFEIGEKGKEMPCMHSFHGGCIEKWLKIHGTCPVCRFKMPVEEKVSSDDKQEQENQDEGEGRRRRGEVWMGFAFGGNNPNQPSSTEESAAAASDENMNENMNDID